MAGLNQDKRSKIWTITARFGGRAYNFSTGTTDKKEATEHQAKIAETIRLLERGSLEPSPEDDLREFIKSGGTRSQKLEISEHKLGETVKEYLDGQFDKEDNTLATERIHLNHFMNIFGGGKKLNSFTVGDFRQYIVERQKFKPRGKPISGVTIKKEFTTFIQLWQFSQNEKYVNRDCPLLNDKSKKGWTVTPPKPEQEDDEKFKTYDEIIEIIAANNLNEKQANELWRGLFLDKDQLYEVLEFIKNNCTREWLYFSCLMAAKTSARRSELTRAVKSDFQFSKGHVIIHEKKRSKKVRNTTRAVPASSDFKREFGPFIANITGHVFQENGEPVTIDDLTNHLRLTMAKSEKWKCIKGFHCFRRSFASCLLRTGKVNSQTIAKWSGHESEYIQKLYQRLFPQDFSKQIDLID